ncbi:MAG: flagellar motor protein MotB [Sphingomonadaceae bacterium]
MSGPLPEPEVLIRKVKVKAHGGGHSGGAWKVAYADFVTAMMAFFLLLWLLGSTSEKERRGIADYFAPPNLLRTQSSGGSNGVLGGRSLQQEDGAASHAQRSVIQLQTGNPVGNGAHVPSQQKAKLEDIEKNVRELLKKNPALQGLEDKVRFTDTLEGLRIELIDAADYSMFVNGTAAMDPRAIALLQTVAEAIATVPNKIAIRGHTDAVPFARTGADRAANNWVLSAIRAEATRQRLARAGIPEGRFARLEGVAHTDPYIATDPFDPRNRRMSITLLQD